MHTTRVASPLGTKCSMNFESSFLPLGGEMTRKNTRSSLRDELTGAIFPKRVIHFEVMMSAHPVEPVSYSSGGPHHLEAC